MKLMSTYLLFIICFLFNSCSNSDPDILLDTNKKLQAFTSVQYNFEYKNYNPITGKLGINDSFTVVFNFKGNDSIFGAHYYLSRGYGDCGYNGLTTFYTIREKKQLVYTSSKSPEDLMGIQSLFLSIKQLRDLLPQMLNDTAIIFSRMTDTIFDNTNCFKFDILMQRKSIGMFGEIVKSKSNRNYSLMIDKKELLPKQFISFYEKKIPLLVLTYDNIKPSVSLNDSLFDYSLQKLDYKKYTFEEFQLVSMNENILKGNSLLGTKALNWTLPSMAGDSVTLLNINADLIMLEFWFPYCTGCVQAIPEINEIQKRYRNKGLKVFGLEFTKPDSSGLTYYIKKMKIEYPTLYSAKEIASGYGVSAGPSVFLIKEGKFVYARTGFIKDELINEIEKNLEGNLVRYR
jgi:thiol-disulfide isomerase/thioredoxin